MVALKSVQELYFKVLTEQRRIIAENTNRQQRQIRRKQTAKAS